jgi:hypothetical protein
MMHKILIYLQIIYLLKSTTCFKHYPAHIQEVYVVIAYMQPLVSSLSAGDCPVHLQRVKIPVAAYIQLRRRPPEDEQIVTIPEAAYIHLRRRPPEDEQGNARNM